MKICSECKIQKPFEEFNKKGNGYQGRCRGCQKAWYKNYYQNSPKEKERLLASKKILLEDIKKIIREAKSFPCMDCKVSYPYYVMDFDHRDPTVKSFNISFSPKWSSIQQVLDEIAKCDVVCSNCHRIRTYCSVGELADPSDSDSEVFRFEPWASSNE